METKGKKEDSTLFKLKCCNPFNEENHPKNVKNLRNVSEWMCSLGLGIENGRKICDKCRKKLSSEKTIQETGGNENNPSTSSQDDTVFIDPGSAVDYLNKSLELIGESPIKKKKLGVPSYGMKKLEKVKSSLEKQLIPDKSTCSDDDINKDKKETDSEIIEQLKVKFSQTKKRSEKVTILTVLPHSWSCKRIEDEFGVSNYMARTVKKLVAEKGILSTPNPKPGKTLCENTADLIKSFYNSDDISRMMPGKKDYVTIRNQGSKIQVQKRLLLANISEIYQLFKEKHPGHHVGFSKFCELKPKNCILVGKSGTHTVCVCTLHQNMKLMINGVGLHNMILDGYEAPIKTYHGYLAKIMCNPPSVNCYMNKCSQCPGTTLLKESLMTTFENNVVDEVSYKQWVTVDRCMMETVTKNIDEFIDEFMENLLKLKTHSFIANRQKESYSELKEGLTEGEVLVNCDFAENYSFILQDEIQSYHWSSSQATIHPFIVYYQWQGKLKHLQYVFISNCLEHNTVAFYVFQSKLVSILKETLPFDLVKIKYFSDGSAAQYKNKKNFLNLCLHKSDFEVQAEWHFFATSHGKSACDGLGGTVKRLAAKASLQRPYDKQILTPVDLFQFAVDNIKNIDFEYCSLEEYEEAERKLMPRFVEARAIVGTQKLHTFIPATENKVFTKHFSSSDQMSKQIVTTIDYITPTDLEEIVSGFVTVEYDNAWWLACILERNELDFKISFLHPKGPANSYSYPKPSDILNVPGRTFLQKVQPNTATGRVYTLSKEESSLSTLALERYLKTKTK
jgi:hypothetical protein